MLFALAAALAVVWALGFLVFRVAGGWVHLVLAAAFVTLLLGLLPRSRRPRA